MVSVVSSSTVHFASRLPYVNDGLFADYGSGE